MPASNNAAADRSLTGPEKAAIAILSLDEAAAAEVLRKMDAKDVQRLTNYIARLHEIPGETVEVVKSEFYNQFMTSQGLDSSQSREKIRNLLEISLEPQRAQEIIETMEAAIENEGIEALKWLDSQTITNFIKAEHPQTIAIVLAHMEADQAAEVLGMLEEEVRSDVCIRMATLERISPSVLQEVNEVIRGEMLAQGASKGQVAGGLEAVAEIMNYLDKEAKSQVLDSIDEVDNTLSDGIRDLMFVFEDLINLDNRGMQMVMKEVNNETLTLALKTASDDMKEKMLKSISERAAKMIIEELEIMGPVRVADVDKAQQEILEIARRLEEEGKIMLQGRGADEFV